MKSIGFLKSNKENEKRIALLPEDVKKIKNRKNLYFEENYAINFGICDEEYEKFGCNICTKNEILQKDIICDPKVGDADYIDDLKDKTIFGWIHAVQNKELTDILIKNKMTVYAWEEMFEKGRHTFWKNNEIAGKAAIIHALLCYGILPSNAKAGILGNGNTARGANKILTQLGIDTYVYTSKMEEKFKQDISNFDIIVNAVLWNVKRKDHIISKEMLKELKKDALIIDVSCDKNGAIETSIPTTIEKPIYEVEGITHYVVDHTPSLFFKTVSKIISEEICKYVDQLVEDKTLEELNNALIIEKGIIKDNKIIEFQGR